MKQSAESSTKKSPWGYQAYLKEEKVLEVEEVIEIVQGIQNLRDRALIILTYLTAGRIREIVRKKDRKSILKSDIKLTDVKERPTLLINLRNQKNKNRKRKNIPVPLDLKENAIFFNLLAPYINDLEMHEELFPISYQRAYKIIHETMGVNPHWIRHLRATHLVVKYGYKEHQLMIYMGWSDPRPAKYYVEMVWQDLMY